MPLHIIESTPSTGRLGTLVDVLSGPTQTNSVCVGPLIMRFNAAHSWWACRHIKRIKQSKLRPTVSRVRIKKNEAERAPPQNCLRLNKSLKRSELRHRISFWLKKSLKRSLGSCSASQKKYRRVTHLRINKLLRCFDDSYYFNARRAFCQPCFRVKKWTLCWFFGAKA